MFRFSTLFSVAALAAVVVALPGSGAESSQGSSELGSAGSTATATNGQCDTGSNFCCDTVQNSSSSAATGFIESLVNVIAEPITAQVGLTCDGVIDLQSCTQQPTCCSGNNYEGLVVIGCSPVNVA